MTDTTDKDMVERVGWAIKKAQAAISCRILDGEFLGQSERRKIIARAAIGEMKESTVEMSDAGHDLAKKMTYDPNDSSHRPTDPPPVDCDEIYQAMINAALGEKT